MTERIKWTSNVIGKYLCVHVCKCSKYIYDLYIFFFVIHSVSIHNFFFSLQTGAINVSEYKSLFHLLTFFVFLPLSDVSVLPFFLLKVWLIYVYHFFSSLLILYRFFFNMWDGKRKKKFIKRLNRLETKFSSFLTFSFFLFVRNTIKERRNK